MKLYSRSVTTILVWMGNMWLVGTHVCFIDRQPDPKRNGELRWALPFEQRCYCDKILVSPKKIRLIDSIRTCPFPYILSNEHGAWWFTDDPLRLLQRQNWKSDPLSQLLECGTRTNSSYEDHTNSQSSVYTSVNAFTSVAKTTTDDHTNSQSSVHTSVNAIMSVEKKTTPDDHTNSQSSVHTSVNTFTSVAKTTTDDHTNSQSSVHTSVNAFTSVAKTTPDDHTNSQSSVHTSVNAFTSVAKTTSEAKCHDYLGVKNGDIPDDNMEASAFNTCCPPSNGRLDGTGYWGANRYKKLPWIQADIGYQTYITGVITHGRNADGTENWVTAIKVSTFLMTTNDPEVFVKNEDGQIKTFDANTDGTTKVESYFPEQVYARIVRITCLDKKSTTDTWNLRFELLGCKK